MSALASPAAHPPPQAGEGDRAQRGGGGEGQRTGPGDRRKVIVHLTPFAPRIADDAGLSHPTRWAHYNGSTPAQAVQTLAERLDRKPARLAFRLGPTAQDVAVFDPTAPTDVLAILTEGLSCADAEAAREALIRGAPR